MTHLKDIVHYAEEFLVAGIVLNKIEYFTVKAITMILEIQDVPADVQMVWAHQYSKMPIGLDTLNRMKEIIRANPEYFPWETKYDSIPQEVHDAYRKEKNAEFDKIWKEFASHNEKYIGIIPSMLKAGEHIPEIMQVPEKSISEIMSDLFKMEDYKRQQKRKQHEEDKALWDKYYKAYQLEYRK